MRWSWLRAAVLGILIGPAPFVASSLDPDSLDSIDSDAVESEGPSLEPSAGHVIEGLNFYVWDEDPRAAADWAVDLLGSGGEKEPWAQLRSVAAKSAGQPSLLTDGGEAELVAWVEASARNDRPVPLGPLLCLLPSLDRTCLVCTCATSPSEQVRSALAEALAAPFEAVGVQEALEYLERDPSAAVRRLARLSVASRRAALA